MKKININLNPKKADNLSGIFAKALNYTPLLVLAVIFFALVLGAVETVSRVKSGRHKNLNDVWRQWEPKHREIVNVKREISALERQGKQIGELMLPQVDGIVLLEGLSSFLPDNIWLESLRFKDNSAQIRGYIVRWEEDTLASLEKFINRLREDESFKDNFKEVNIRDTQRVSFRGREVTQFFLEWKK